MSNNFRMILTLSGSASFWKKAVSHRYFLYFFCHLELFETLGLVIENFCGTVSASSLTCFKTSLQWRARLVTSSFRQAVCRSLMLGSGMYCFVRIITGWRFHPKCFVSIVVYRSLLVCIFQTTFSCAGANWPLTVRGPCKIWYEFSVCTIIVICQISVSVVANILRLVFCLFYRGLFASSPVETFWVLHEPFIHSS